jgi:outer membrane protein
VKKLYFIILFFLLIFTKINAEQNIVYVDINFIMANSKAGKNINSQIEKIHKNNISYFQKKEKELKKNEEDIIKQKNIISKEEFKKKIEILRGKANEYRKSRKEKIDKITKQRLTATSKIVKELKPILADYADQNSISIIIQKKNIIIGKSNLDITNDILSLLDKKINKINLD